VSGLAELCPLQPAEVDEPETITLQLEMFSQLLEAERDRGIEPGKRPSRKNQDLMITCGPLGPGNVRRYFEAALTSAADQDLSLD
jgi:hypothetical protein